jgi:glycerophosphoryl diester phosphodiesterase
VSIPRVSPQPLVYAHRGASSSAPENTLAAFRLAREQGAHGIELDIKLTADGEAVVVHDQSVNRTTNGEGAVRTLLLEDIRRLDAGSRFSQQYAGERIPTLAEVFETLGDSMLYDLELTNYASPWDNLPCVVAALVRKYQLENNIIATSFFPPNLTRFTRCLPGSTVAIISLPGPAGQISRGWLGRMFSPDMIAPHHTSVDGAFVARARAAGRKIFPWTVDQDADLKRLAELKVDAVITNMPAKARQLFEVA